MPYDFHWHDEAHTIIRYEVHGKITWQDWHDAVDQIVAELAKHPYRIDVIFNTTAGLPPGNPIPHIKWAKDKLGKCQNLNRVVTVSPKSQSMLIQAFINIVERVRGAAPLVLTMDEAMKIITVAREKETVS